MTDPRISTFTAEVAKVMHYLHSEYAKLQTGQANAAIIENVMVDAYGQKQPLKAVAGISVQDGRTLVVQPWDKSVMQAVDTALQKADLGTSPVNDGTVIRINLPPMTEERRLQLKKIVAQQAEEARISIRQQRQTAHDKIKNEESDEDVRYTLLDSLQKEVDKANAEVEETMKKKEEEVMTV